MKLKLTLVVIHDLDAEWTVEDSRETGSEANDDGQRSSKESNGQEKARKNEDNEEKKPEDTPKFQATNFPLEKWSAELFNAIEI